MQFGRGGMGTHKHGISGVAPRNTREKRQFGYQVNRQERESSKRKPKAQMLDSCAELFGGR